MKRFAILILVLMSVSGCICQGGTEDIGKSLGLCETKEPPSPDKVLIITDSKVSPSKIFPEGTARVLVSFQNIDPKEDLNGIRAELFDTWLTEIVDSNPSSIPYDQEGGYCMGGGNCNEYDLMEDCHEDANCQWSKSYVSIQKLSPGGTRRVEWVIKAPTEDKMGSVKASAPLKYRIMFPFNGQTIRELIIMDEEEYQTLLDSGEPFPISGQAKKGGPVKLDIEIGTDRPVLENKKVPVYVQAKNVGDGFVSVGKIMAGDLDINLPDTVTGYIGEEPPEGETDTRDFECVDGETCRHLRNKNDLEFFEDKTDRLMFEISTAEVSSGYETHDITATFSYDYELRGQEVLEVEPYD